MKHITKILFGFMCGVLLCTAPCLADLSADEKCNWCQKTMFPQLQKLYQESYGENGPNKCGDSSFDTEMENYCIGIGATYLSECLSYGFSKMDDKICYEFEEKDYTAKDFCIAHQKCEADVTTCRESCPSSPTYRDAGDTVVVTTYECSKNTNWYCKATEKTFDVLDGAAISGCTDGTCEKYDCHYNNVLHGVICRDSSFQTPYCTCIADDKEMMYIRLSCNSNDSYDYENNIVNCGSNYGLYCDMSVQGSVGMCRYKKECQNCQPIIDWTSDGGGYQVYTTATCDYRTGTCNKSYKYRCDKGYYGNPTSSRTGCKRCPDNAICDTPGTTAFSCAAGYYKASNNATSCTKCPENAKDCPAGSTTFECKTGYYKESTTATKCTNCPAPSSPSWPGNNYKYSDATGTDIGVTSCALAVRSKVEDDGGYYEIIDTPCQYQQGKQ